MKIQDSLSFQAFSLVIPLFMKDEGMTGFSLSMNCSSTDKGVDIAFSLPDGSDDEKTRSFTGFMEKLVAAERLLSCLQTVASLKESGVKESFLGTFISEANEKKRFLYGDSVKGDFNEGMFDEKR